MQNTATQRALEYHQAGQLNQAKALYLQILQSDPNNPPVRHLLGLVAYQQNDYKAALRDIRHAIQLNPNQPDYHSNLGLVLRANGEAEQAIFAYKTALNLNASDPEIHNNLGNAYYVLKQFEMARSCYQQALQLSPEYTLARINLGNTLSNLGDYLSAETCFRHALRSDPSDPDIHYGLATVLRLKGAFQQALKAYQDTLRLNNIYPSVHRYIGWLLQENGQPQDAVNFYRQAVQLDPNDETAFYNLGNALRELSLFSEAEINYREALRINPHDADIYNNLGNTLRELGQLEEAITCYRNALRIDPAMHHAKVHLLHQCQHACEWQDIDTLSHQVRSLVNEKPEAQVSPFALLAIPNVSAEEHRRCSENWVANQYLNAKPLFKFQPVEPKRLRLGYLAADFHEHATAYLMAEVFELHDRERFEIFAYSYGPDDHSEMRHRLVKSFDQFVDIRSSSHEVAARKIHLDGIDILIDLKGYTAHTRSQILAYRPAPVQVNFLGYPGTLGDGLADYLIGDPCVTPTEHAAGYSEHLIQMPHSYQPNDRNRKVDITPTRTSCGLPEDGFVFCGFNQSFKIQPHFFDVWMKLLQQVPGSVLWLLDNNPLATSNLQKEAQLRGVNAERLIFAPRLPLSQHLARQALADMLLDTLPYNAHTTASDALWAGVPVVTCLGETFAGRVAASLLKAVGLPELITSNLEDYADLAYRLASSPDTLNGIKQKLSENRKFCALFDTPQWTRDLEVNYEKMWESFLSKYK